MSDIHIEDRIRVLQEIVETADAIFVGMQNTFTIMAPDLVLFTSKKTGSTYSLPDDEFFTSDAVKNRVETLDARFFNSPVKIPRASLLDMAKKLYEAAAELENYAKGKK